MGRGSFGGLCIDRACGTILRMSRREHQLELLLECLECGDASDEARGWKAYLDEESTLLVYCAACAEREFGE